MSRPVSLTLIQATNASESGECPIILITIDHPNLVQPIRVCSDNVNTVSNGNTFVSCPFEVNYPVDSDDQPPTATLKIDNVDQEQVRAIRSINSAPIVTIQVVRAADPDTLEAEWVDFELTEAKYDVLEVSGSLGVENFLSEPFSGINFDPSRFPAVF